MKTIFRVQYFFRKEWKKTYFGNQYEGGIFHFDTLEQAKKEIENMHEWQRENHKKLTKYRIVELTFAEKIHENF